MIGTFKDLFNANLLSGLAEGICDIDILDLREGRAFSFFSVSGLLIILIVSWFLGAPFDVGLGKSCSVEEISGEDCVQIWSALAMISFVCIASIFVVRVISRALNGVTFANNALLAFLFSGALLALLRVKIEGASVYTAITSALYFDTVWMPDLMFAALCSTAVVCVLAVRSAALRDGSLIGTLQGAGLRDVLIVAAYIAVVTALTFLMFKY